ncbi:MAG: YbhB/YbcL family Raf kinase inhibitor-like protein [Paraburkholderia sp.]|uniref:YbhB/YbcL family Raf kinase inhibitor-like protein n=1 Tax=Paraburkholderia sp. TaxID=1926495 RepID=UPI001208D437|nr:YbhB/YbcL family Raf kinase inhibitor-like protein [Paraburkholderia sp.]TAL96950.1 MAG: YbhB/YbcL family Raf kinase inhibitor-like protein [Paraburkholderia sp.]
MRSRCLVVSPAALRFRLPSLVLAISSLALFAAQGPRALAQGTFGLSSTSFRAGGSVGDAQVFDQDGCKGGNRSPQLSWHDAPAGTRGFAISIVDPDAPGRGWWHWAVAGIPSSVDRLPENASASGYLQKLGAVEARNDFDIDGYGGPCPPAGKPHHYVVTVYALDTLNLRIAQGRPALMFEHEIDTATLGSARMVVTYGR